MEYKVDVAVPVRVDEMHVTMSLVTSLPRDPRTNGRYPADPVPSDRS
jgi:hypothetical protein